MSTVWDRIYKKYLLGEEGCGCLSTELLPEFLQFGLGIRVYYRGHEANCEKLSLGVS